jgi:hypothetical protein
LIGNLIDAPAVHIDAPAVHNDAAGQEVRSGEVIR